jgi:hypothetical protein
LLRLHFEREDEDEIFIRNFGCLAVDCTALRKGADKYLAFPNFPFASPKEFLLDGLKKLEQRSHKCVELKGNM